ncbi:MAG: hypothetical protein AAFQ14_18470 [Cyanobacteria bacterium J06621_12]
MLAVSTRAIALKRAMSLSEGLWTMRLYALTNGQMQVLVSLLPLRGGERMTFL